MAGKRHHYLPRFLQKGFSSRQNGKEVYTWVFKKAIDPYETNIINVGTEKLFYGVSEELSLDDDITEKELEFSPLLEELRGYSSDAKIENNCINEFVVHIVTRTRHIRLSMEEMGQSFFAIMHKYISSPTELNKLLLRYIRENPNELRKSIQESLAENGTRNVDPRMLDRATKLAIKNAPQLLQSPAFLGMRLGLIHGFKLLEKDMPKLVEKSHIKALSKEVVPSAMIARLRALQWMLSVQLPNSFILGDIGPLVTKRTNGEIRSLFLLEDGDVKQVYFPISHSHMIIGSLDGNYASLGADIINASSASFSKEFFIGRQVTEQFYNYRELIGTKSSLFSEKELQEMERDFVRDIFEKSN
jgi:hypothetical protein